MTPEEEIVRAQEAQMILDNPLFKGAVQEIEEALLLGIRQSAFKDADLREKLCQQYTLLHSLVGQFKSYLGTGKFAEAILAQRVKEGRKRAVNG